MNIFLTFLLLLNTVDNPPGTLKIRGIYVDKTEISNIGWIEFLTSVDQTFDSVTVSRFLPDSSNVWFTDIDKKYQPIVLITYEQALAYCKWRSIVVSENLGRKVTYRLPTPQEWQKIARMY